jgi:hypothetical protein
METTESATRVDRIVSQRFEVWIICTRGNGHQWRKMCELPQRWQAEQFIAWHKEIDAKFPIGHYRYKIEEMAG